MIGMEGPELSPSKRVDVIGRFIQNQLNCFLQVFITWDKLDQISYLFKNIFSLCIAAIPMVNIFLAFTACRGRKVGECRPSSHQMFVDYIILMILKILNSCQTQVGPFFLIKWVPKVWFCLGRKSVFIRSICLFLLVPVWPNWANFERSWQQILLQK